MQCIIKEYIQPKLPGVCWPAEIEINLIVTPGCWSAIQCSIKQLFFSHQRQCQAVAFSGIATELPAPTTGPGLPESPARVLWRTRRNQWWWDPWTINAHWWKGNMASARRLTRPHQASKARCMATPPFSTERSLPKEDCTSTSGSLMDDPGQDCGPTSKPSQWQLIDLWFITWCQVQCAACPAICWLGQYLAEFARAPICSCSEVGILHCPEGSVSHSQGWLAFQQILPTAKALLDPAFQP